MKKLLLLFAAMLVAVAASHAQTPTATLSHEGTVKCFYGADAFVNAVDEAADGDIINLSSGYFNGTDIDKAVSIKGAGMSADTINVIEQTIIGLDGKSHSITNNDVNIEGIYFLNRVELKATNIKINKCTFKGELYQYSGTEDNILINYLYNCKCLSTVGRYSSATLSYANLNVINCYIDAISIGQSPTYNFSFINSIIGSTSANNYYCSFINCIIIINNSNYLSYINSSNYVYYCVGYNQNGTIFNHIIDYNNTNSVVSNLSELFKTFSGTNYSEYETFELTTEAASTYLGDDGTQVGIYGGSMPFNPRVNNPYITKCTVAEKSTPQGTLSVHIEVKPAQ